MRRHPVLQMWMASAELLAPSSCYICCAVPADGVRVIGGWPYACSWRGLEAFVFQMFTSTSPPRPMGRRPH